MIVLLELRADRGGAARPAPAARDPGCCLLAGISFFLAALPVLPGGDALLEAIGDGRTRRGDPARLAPVPGPGDPGAAARHRRRRHLGPRAGPPGTGGDVVGRRAAGRRADPAPAEPGLGLPGRLDNVDVPGRLASGGRPPRGGRAGPQRRPALAGGYRGFEWNGRRAVLDPAPRYLPGEVLIDDRLFVDGTPIPSEDPLVDDVAEALEAEDPASALRDLGVRWVVVETRNARRGRCRPGRPSTTAMTSPWWTSGRRELRARRIRVQPRIAGRSHPCHGLFLGSLFLLGFRRRGTASSDATR